MTDTQCIELFRTHLRDEKHSPKNTLESYVRDISQFSEYLNEHTDRSLVTATPADTNAYISELRDLGKSVSTVSRSIASIKNFYVQLCIKKIISHSPATTLKPEKATPQSPTLMTEEEIKLLLDQPRCIDAKGYRDHALLETMYSTGMRVSELLDLNVDDVLLDEKAIVCHGKDKDRKVPLSDTAYTALSNYIELVRPQMVTDEDNDALFVNVSGERLSRQGFWKIIKAYSASAGIQKDITPHTLRQSFAAHMVKGGANASDLQNIMGFADSSSSQVYSKLVKASLREIYNKAHPKS